MVARVYSYFGMHGMVDDRFHSIRCGSVGSGNSSLYSSTMWCQLVYEVYIHICAYIQWWLVVFHVSFHMCNYDAP